MKTLEPQLRSASTASWLTSRRAAVLLAAIMCVSAVMTTLAMRSTSTTFDEIVMIAGGARGYETGDWSLVPEHPPFTQYVYGLPVYLLGQTYPDESGVRPEVREQMAFRYWYAQQFFWRSGNDHESITFAGRLPAVAMALLLVALVYVLTNRIAGRAAALLAALLVAFLPDVLAHGGVSYNDVPVTLAMFGALWASDRAIRSTRADHAVVAGLLVGLALTVKNSAVALAPMLLLLLLMEAWTQRSRPGWGRRIGVAMVAGAAAIYLALVVVYRGDLSLTEYRYSIEFAFGHVTGNVPAYLLGERSIGGFWYYFPVAFLFKTSAGLHVILIVAAFALLRRLRGGVSLSALSTSQLRAPAVGILVFGLLLVTSSLNIGFRYAMPLLPWLIVIATCAIARGWHDLGRRMHLVVGAAALWAVAHSVSYYPYFLTYISEYGPGREHNYRVLADSNVDWGQGLLALRDFMRDNDIERVRLSYFGSALPDGYGIQYEPLRSFFPLRRPVAPSDSIPPAQWMAVSATNLAGVYLDGDPYGALRDVRPDHVLANSIYLYRVIE